jgi:general stress protein YciG
MAHENLNTQDNGQGPRTAQAEAAQPPAANNKKSNRGFASMDRSKQREIASKGGRAAHEKGTAHQFSSNEAREAGRKGGGAVSKDRQHMAEIGRVGGMARGRKQREQSGSEPPASASSEASESETEASDSETDVAKAESKDEEGTGDRSTIH